MQSIIRDNAAVFVFLQQVCAQLPQIYSSVVMVQSTQRKTITSYRREQHSLLEVYVCDESDDSFVFKVWGNMALYYYPRLVRGTLVLFHNCGVQVYRSVTSGCLDRESSIHVLRSLDGQLLLELEMFPKLQQRMSVLLKWALYHKPLYFMR